MARTRARARVTEGSTMGKNPKYPSTRHAVLIGFVALQSHAMAQNIVVAEYFSNDTQVLTPSGNLLCMFGATNKTERFYGIVFNSKGELFVAGHRTNNIRKFSPTGADLGDFAHTPNTAESITFDLAGNLYLTGEGDFVEKYASDGTYLGHFAPTDGGDGNSVACDSSGVLYVLSYGSGTIRRYTASGTPLGVFATGLSAGQGMAFDSAGNLFVAERGQGGQHLHQIHRFDASGFDLGTFGSSVLTDPIEIAIGPSDVLYVSDFGDKAVRKFSNTGTYLGDFATNIQSPSGIAFQPVSFEKVVPTSVTLSLGGVSNGSLGSLASDDSNPYNLCKSFVPNVRSPFIRFVVKGNTTLSSPQSLTFRVKGRMIHAGAFQLTLKQYNFANAAYEESRADPFNLTLSYYDLPGSGTLSRYVGLGGQLQSQVEVQQVGFSATPVPCASFEFVNWNVSL